MIICGWAGIGKTTLSKITPWIDLESTPFERDWERYATVARHMDKQGHTVMVSMHKQLRDVFERDNVGYLCVVPDDGDKLRYKKKYEMRGNDDKFVENVLNQWDAWMDDLVSNCSPNMILVQLPPKKQLAYFYDILKGE
jgi:hypothetical protein